MTLGMIARCDDGGLGTITREVFRHVKPDKTLVVRLGDKGRGVERPERFAFPLRPDGPDDDLIESGWVETADVPVRQCGYPIPDHALDWLLDGCDTIYSAETPYHPSLPRLAAERGIRFVLHAMPELLADEYVERTTEIWLPTRWQYDRVVDRFRSNRVVHTSVPVALDRLPERDFSGDAPLHFRFVDAPAMLDRAGHSLFTAAAAIVTDMDDAPWGDARPVFTMTSNNMAEYWETTEGCDVLVAPRRYGGLSLPVQEAAARGVPSIVLARDPYTPPEVQFTVPVPTVEELAEWHRMKGGEFLVHDTRSAYVADAIVRCCTDMPMLASRSLAAREWAARHSWDALGDLWRKELT